MTGIIQQVNFDAVDWGRIDPFKGRSIALDVARSEDDPLELNLAGTFIYLDDDSDGKVYIRLNDKDGLRVPTQAGFSANNLLYRRLFLDWDAQSGKSINLVYGADAQFNPTNDIANIGSITNDVGVSSEILDTAYGYVGALTTLQTIVTPAANTAGIIIYGVGGMPVANNALHRFMAKTSAPSSLTDVTANTIAFFAKESGPKGESNLVLPIRLKAGLGLYFQKNETGANLDWIEYEIL